MRKRVRPSAWLTALNAHIAAVGLLLLLVLVLATRLVVAWHAGNSDKSAQYEADMVTYGHMQATSGHLRDLPAQLRASEKKAQAFEAARVPGSDSEVLTELGSLTEHNHVTLSRAGYAPRLALPGLVEYRIDAVVSGQYTDVMHFINAVERDKSHAFFLIRSITLSGQQGGEVNLRLAMDTYIRADAAQAAALRNASASSGGGETQ